MNKGKRNGAATGTRAGARMDELSQNARHVAELLKSMANPARLVILCRLAECECSVGELERAVGLSQSAISQHLAVLRRNEVVACRRDGQTVFYSLASSDIVTVMGTLHAVFCSERSPKAAGSRLRTRVA
jgi:DNA-binding transcriptional ArsR family regulator